MTVRPVATVAFWPFFVTQAAAAVVDSIARAAVIAWAAFGDKAPFGWSADLTASLAAAALVLPFVPLLGTSADLADADDRAKLVRRLAIAQVPLAMVCAAGMVAQSPGVLFVGLIGLGVRAALFGSVKYAFVGDLVPDTQIVSATSLVQASTWVAVLVGGIVGVGVVGVPWIGGTFDPAAVGLAIVGIAAVGAWTASLVPSAPAGFAFRLRRSFVQSGVDAWRRTVANPYVFRALLARAWFWAVGGVVVAEVPVWTTRVLSAPAEVATAWQAVLAAGVAGGAGVAHRMSRGRVELGVIPVGGALLALGLLALAVQGAPWPAASAPLGVRDLVARPGAWGLAAGLFLTGLGGGLYAGPLSAYVLWRTPPGDRARVVAGGNALDAVQMVALALLWGALGVAGLGPVGTFALLGVAMAVVSVVVTAFVPEFLLRFLAWCVSNVMYRLQVQGLEHVPKEGPCLVVANHVSFVDWLIVGGALRRPARFVMYAGYYNNPLFRGILDLARAIPIASSKEDPKVMEAAFDAVARELDEGSVVVIFPEGHLTADGAIDRFRPGVERILARNAVPVVPMALNGLWGSMFSRKDGPALSRPPRGFRAPLWLTVGEALPGSQSSASVLEQRVRAMWSLRPDAP